MAVIVATFPRITIEFLIYTFSYAVDRLRSVRKKLFGWYSTLVTKLDHALYFDELKRGKNIIMRDVAFAAT
jgi:hypothetical protein